MQIPHQSSDDVVLLERGARWRVFTFDGVFGERWLNAKWEKGRHEIEPGQNERVRNVLVRAVPDGWKIVPGTEVLNVTWGQVKIELIIKASEKPKRRRRSRAAVGEEIAEIDAAVGDAGQNPAETAGA
jgi:hypothetical protein